MLEVNRVKKIDALFFVIRDLLAVGIALVVKKNTRRNPVDMLEVISKVEGVTFIEETL